MKYKINLIFLITLHQFIFAQNGIQVDIDPRNPTAGDVFSYFIKVKNSKITDISTPNFGKLNVVEGPIRQTYEQNILGNSSSETIIYYQLMAASPGAYTIGGIDIISNGKKLKIPPKTINVSQGSQNNLALPPNQKLSGDAFVELITHKTSYYVGEQIIATLRLYHNSDINGYSIDSLPNPSGAVLHTLKRDLDNQPKIMTQNGKKYVVHDLKQISIIPNKAGTLTLNPVQIIVQKNDPFSLFGNGDKQRLSSPPLSLSIKNLPTPAKEGFSGAVGRYKASVRFDNQESNPNGSISMFMTIEGNGLSSAVVMPTLKNKGHITFFGPTNLNEIKEEQIDGLYHVLETKYDINSQVDTVLEFKPSFVYFDTESSTYKDAFTSSTKLIFSGPNSQTNLNQAISELDSKSNSFNWTGGLIGLITGIATFGLGLFIYRKYKKHVPANHSNSQDYILDSHKPISKSLGEIAKKEEPKNEDTLKGISAKDDLIKYMPVIEDTEKDLSIHEKISDIPSQDFNGINSQNYSSKEVNIHDVKSCEEALLQIAQSKIDTHIQNIQDISKALKNHDQEVKNLFESLKLMIDYEKFGRVPIALDQYKIKLQKWGQML
jgi:hypothetical protein